MNASQKIEVGAETLAAEARFAAGLRQTHKRLTRELEDRIIETVEGVLGVHARILTPLKYKITIDPEDPEVLIFTILRFEAKVYA